MGHVGESPTTMKEEYVVKTIMLMITVGLGCLGATACDAPELRDVDLVVDVEKQSVLLADADGQQLEVGLDQVVLQDDEGVEMSLAALGDSAPSGPQLDIPLVDDIDPSLVCCYGCFITPYGVFCNYCDPFGTCSGGSGGSSGSTSGGSTSSGSGGSGGSGGSIGDHDPSDGPIP